MDIEEYQDQPRNADPYADEFKCERCNQIFDIEESVRLDFVEDSPLVCEYCAWVYYRTSKETKGEM